ncbi:universal stress protein [Dyella tabacisoli]|uniref:Universal stress protein n=1 Tax=Dyella tabacisoli TaxID=2282381 RepID=A0A369UN58_9GAMM|nr:universal stress protein [Dyella tabacisoli]RDD81961.1 universal stress protein [Dyella tabacisoli]
MPHTDLLLYLDHLDFDAAGPRAALALAKRMRSRLDALYVADLPAAAFSLPESVPVQLEETRRRCLDAEAHADSWQSLLTAHGLSGTWRVAQGDTVQTLCQAASGYDLLIMERRQQRSDAPVGFGTVSRSVFGSGRPVLVVPDNITRIDQIGARVLVAWNGSRESVLALAAAVPLLQQCQDVLLLDGSEMNQDTITVLPPPGLADWLQRRGIQAQIKPIDAGPAHAAGPLLLEAAHAHRADMIVMGAWSRSRLAEMMLGGTTRHLFMHSDLPMFVAH